MIKKTISTLAITLLLSSVPMASVSANTHLSVGQLSLTDTIRLDSVIDGLSSLSIKKNEPYDPAKDSALRRGTENWDEPQWSFFVMPAVILGIIGLWLFFNRD